ncbi:MAG: Sec-independent protein translocase protein TatB [Methylophilaceae bacterium]
MFDVSFAELMMVAVVGLLVIGPERLPKVARTLGAYTGRLQRYVSQVKEEVNREMRFEELQALQQEIKEGADKVQTSIRDGEQSINDTLTTIESGIKRKRKAPVRKAKTSAKKVAVKKPAAKKTSAKKTPVRKPSVKQAKNKA